MTVTLADRIRAGDPTVWRHLDNLGEWLREIVIDSAANALDKEQIGEAADALTALVDWARTLETERDVTANKALEKVARAHELYDRAERRAADAQAEFDRLTAALAAANELLGWAIAIIENADHCMGYDLMTQFGRDIAPDEAGEWADARNKWREAFHARFTEMTDDAPH